MTPTLAAGPKECVSWCDGPHGHTDVRFVEDQHCDTETTDLPVTLESRWDYSDGSTEVAQSMILARQNVGQPAFVVWVNTKDRETKLTPGEAREHAAALVAMADLIEGR